jgi:hypothetical protein
MNGFVVLGAVTGQKPHANAWRLHSNLTVARLASAIIAHFVATKESPNEENCSCVRTDDFPQCDECKRESLSERLRIRTLRRRSSSG